MALERFGHHQVDSLGKLTEQGYSAYFNAKLGARIQNLNMTDTWWSHARAQMLLAPEVINLNSGSFGPLPRVVFDRVTELRPVTLRPWLNPSDSSMRRERL